MDLTPKQQTSEAIRQANSILILTGQHPSVDQTVAVISLAMILRKFGKQAVALISDTLPQAVASLDTSILSKDMGGIRDFVLKLDVTKSEVDKLRYEVTDGKLNVIITPYKGNFAPSDVTFDYGEGQASCDLVIALGVPTRSRIDRQYDPASAAFAEVPLINIDFHRSNENYGAVNLIDTNASSLCEILVALSESLQSGIVDAEIATPLLMGLMASTDRFTASHTTSKSLTVAAQMMAAGAKQQNVVRALYREGRSEGRGNDGRGNDGRENRETRERSGSGRANDNRNESRRDNARDSSRREESLRREDSLRRDETARRDEPIRSEPTRHDARQETARQEFVRVEEAVLREAPVATAAQPSAPAVRPAQPEVEPELPIIAPGHIEMSQAQPTPELAGVQVNQPAPAYEVKTVAPGRLPVEMSPAMDLGVASSQPVYSRDDVSMPQPSTLRNDG